jgi:hypothetical protein
MKNSSTRHKILQVFVKLRHSKVLGVYQKRNGSQTKKSIYGPLQIIQQNTLHKQRIKISCIALEVDVCCHFATVGNTGPY